MTRATALLVCFFCACSIEVGLSETVTFGAIGDFGAAWKGTTGYSNELAVANLMKSWNADLIVTLGDNNYPEGKAESIDVNIGQFFREYIHPYLGSYGAGAVSNRFWPSLGNHDWGFPMQTVEGVQPHYDYFTLPGNERYYSFRYSFLEFFAVSSDDVEPDGNTVDSVQALWLRNALASSTAQWRVVYFHDAPFSSGQLHGTWTGESEGRKMSQWPFREWGASVVLTAHDHLYERVSTNGLTFFVCGPGGDRLDNVHYPLVAGSQTNITQIYGALRVDATETNLTFRFINVEGLVMDTHIIGEVRIAPAITLEPQSQQAPVGSDVVLRVAADGSPPLRYQWFLEGADAIQDATNATLLLPNVQLSQAGDYFAVVTNLYGSATSTVATITVDLRPAITAQPQSQEAPAGSDVSLSVVAYGQPPLSYQWFFNGSEPVPDATQATLVLTNVQLAQAGYYSAVVTNSYGGATSAVATVRIAGSLGLALDAPTYNWVSDPAWFGQVAVSHDGVDAAQSAPIGDGQLSPLQTTIMGPGLLRFWWKVSSESDADVLSFSVSGSFTNRISGEVDWRQETVYLPTSFRIVRWQYSKSGSASAGADAAWVDQVTFQSGETKPIITRQPADLVVPRGASPTFQVAAVGTPTLRYQWFFNGLMAVVHGTNAFLTLTNVQVSHSGSSFHVVITNRLGLTTSTTAHLTVLEPFLFSGAQLSNGWFRCTVSGAPFDGRCVIEASTDFMRWEPVYTNTSGQSQFDFSTPVLPSEPVRFYRARVQ